VKDVGLWLLWGVYRKSPLGYSGEPSLNPDDNRPPKRGAHNPQHFHRKLRPSCARYKGGLYDVLWEHTKALSNSTRPYRGTPSPQKRVG